MFRRCIEAGIQPPHAEGLSSGSEFWPVFRRLHDLYLAQGREDVAERVLKAEAVAITRSSPEVIAAAEERFGAAHPNMARLLHYVAIAHHRLGEHEEARRIEERARCLWVGYSLEKLQDEDRSDSPAAER